MKYRARSSARLLAAACTSALASAALVPHAEATIQPDPDAIGLTDVVSFTDPAVTTLLGQSLVDLDILPHDVSVAHTSLGALRIDGGHTLTNEAGYLGYFLGSDGSALVTGAGSTWANTSSLIIGREGTGLLEILDGGAVTNAQAKIAEGEDSIGRIDVIDAGSTWTSTSSLSVGHGGVGTLNIGLGGAVSNTTGHIASSTNATGTATVTGLNSTWTNTSDLYIGKAGEGTLNVEAGGSVSGTTATIGALANAIGTATVVGLNSTWTNTSDLYVGKAGDGTLVIQFRGVVSNRDGIIADAAGSTGIATVTGPDIATWTNTRDLYVGKAGAGMLAIDNRGVVSNRDGIIASSAGSTGTVTVNGTNGVWTNAGNLHVGGEGGGVGRLTTGHGGNVHVGDAAKDGAIAGWLTVSDADNTDGTGDGGQLFVRNGSTLSQFTSSVIGHEATEYGYATVTGANATWTNGSDLVVGLFGQGTLRVEAGGAVSNRVGYIASVANATGLVTVTGAGSTWTHASDLVLGQSGQGTLNIENGGTVTNALGYIGRFAGSVGSATVTGAGSTWDNGSILRVGESGEGALNIENGGAVTSGAVFIGLESGSTGSATVNGVGSTWTLDNYLSVGVRGQGTLNVENGGHLSLGGNLFLNSATAAELNFILASTGDPLIDVGDDVTLGGTLNVSLDAGLTLAHGDVFTLIDTDDNRSSVSGVFSNVAEGGLLLSAGGIDLLLSYTGGDGNDVIAYAVASIVMGDLNGDGALTHEDIAPFVSALTDPDQYAVDYPGLDPNQLGDFTGDGLLTNGDIEAFVDALNGAGSSAIPEPTSLALLAISGLMVARRRRG